MTDAGRPLVSIVVPMLDEIDHIDACLDGFAAQTWPLAHLEVLVVDGGSSDGSAERVRTRSERDSWLTVHTNPKRRASAAFNVGVAAASGDVIVLFGAHAVADADFVARSVLVLEQTGAAGVGGRLRHEGGDAVARGIGLAMTSRFGMASPFRYATTRQDVDTIGHPAYVAGVLRAIGPFDESLARNSDYELNYRLRSAGHRLVFDPSITSSYRPRSTLSGLARQFWHYGVAKAVVVRDHPGSLRPRHVVPPAAVAVAVSSPALLRSRTGSRAVAVGAIAYTVAAAVATAATRNEYEDASRAATIAAFPVMHGAWGAGLLWSLLGAPVRTRAARRW